MWHFNENEDSRQAKLKLNTNLAWAKSHEDNRENYEKGKKEVEATKCVAEREDRAIVVRDIENWVVNIQIHLSVFIVLPIFFLFTIVLMFVSEEKKMRFEAKFDIIS